MAKSKPKLTATQTLEKFVLRARRIAAHSLTQSREQLHKNATTILSGRITLAGKIEATEELPEEESFESLVARLRPLILNTESIYYVNVLDAIDELTHERAQPEDKERIAELHAKWHSTDAQGTQIQGYTLQAVRPEKGATSVISDSQLAAGWIYIDLVHVDPRGAKTESLEHSLKDRFTAAVRIYSRVAELTLETLDYVEELRSQSVVVLAEEAWAAEVTVAQEEDPVKVQLFVSEIGTAAPDLAHSDPATMEQWKPFQITDLLSQKPENQIAVVARYENESEEFDAAVMQRETAPEGEKWEILVDNCAIYTLILLEEDGKVTSCRFDGRKNLTHTNTQRLRSARLTRKFYDAKSIEFSFPNGGTFSLTLMPQSGQALRDLRVVEEAMGDVVAIESVSGQEIDICDGEFNDDERILLRQTRLLWEGQVVRTLMSEGRVTSRNGKPPGYARVKAGSITFAGRAIPTPVMHLSHENLEALPFEGPRTKSEGTARDYHLRAPEGRLLAWSPERFVTPEDGAFSVSPLNLIGIDEANLEDM